MKREASHEMTNVGMELKAWFKMDAGRRRQDGQGSYGVIVNVRCMSRRKGEQEGQKSGEVRKESIVQGLIGHLARSLQLHVLPVAVGDVVLRRGRRESLWRGRLDDGQHGLPTFAL